MRFHVSHATILACYVGRQLFLWIAGYLLDLWGTEDQRLLGTGRRRYQSMRERSRVELGGPPSFGTWNQGTCTPREPAHVPCAGGSRTNQAAPKATLLRHLTTRPTGDENRTQLCHGLDVLKPRAGDTTSRDWSRSANLPQRCLCDTAQLGATPRITIRTMTSQLLLLPAVAVPITPDPDFTGSQNPCLIDHAVAIPIYMMGRLS